MTRLRGVTPTADGGGPAVVIGSYETYELAQRAVDHLSDSHFPVELVTIVGSDLRLVERVTGRLNYGRALISGAGGGAWFGLLVGLLVSVFGDADSWAPLVGLGIGAAFGAVFGLLAYGATGGRRDFTSRTQVVASRYEVTCAPERAEDAQNLLIKLGWRTGTQG